MLPLDEDDDLNATGHRAYRRLREIAQQLGRPIEMFYGTRPDEDAELQELLRLWHVITDPVGRRRVLDLARQEARWSGDKDES